MVPRAEILETEVEWLHSIKADFVVICLVHTQLFSTSSTFALYSINFISRETFVKNRCLMLSPSRAVQRLMLGYVLSVLPISGDIFDVLLLLSIFVCLVWLA